MGKVYLIFILLSVLIFNTSYATEPLPENLTNLSSSQGMNLLKENININAIKLISHFTTQKNLTYCGIASAVMILNSSSLNAPDDTNHPPYHYFDQDNFFNTGVLKITTPEEVSKNGINLLNLSKAIEANGLKATPVFSNDIDSVQFRELIKNALYENKFVIVNFLRSEIKPGDCITHP